MTLIQQHTMLSVSNANRMLKICGWTSMCIFKFFNKLYLTLYMAFLFHIYKFYVLRFIYGLVIYKSTQLKQTLWSGALLKRPLDSFPAFYGTRRFNTGFTKALHLFLPWARKLQSTSPNLTSPRSILISSTHLRFGLPRGHFPSCFPTYTRSSSPPPPFVLHVPPISSSLT
jgi:hypothetical protein